MSTKTDARETVDAILDLLLDALEKRQEQRDTAEPERIKPEPLEIEEATDEVLEPEPPAIVGTPLPESWRVPVHIIVPRVRVLEAITPAIMMRLAEGYSSLLHAMSLPTAEALSDEALDALPIEVFNRLEADVQRHIVERLGIEEEVVEVEEAEEVVISAESAAEPAFEPPVLVTEPALSLANREPLQSTGMGQTVRRMFIGLIFFVVIANIPINYSQLNEWLGTSAADGVQTVRVVRDGLLIRAVGDHKVYKIENNRRRWITTREAFEAQNLRWAAIREVTPAFLEEIEEGAPLYLLMQCYDSPHIYALDTGGNAQARVKRWIKDVPTLESMRDQWWTVQRVDCHYLRSIRSGEPFPADAGTAPIP